MSERGGCVRWDVVVQRVMVVCTGSRWSSPKVALLNRPNYYVIPQTVDQPFMGSISLFIIRQFTLYANEYCYNARCRWV